jgi:hypothetical protein
MTASGPIAADHSRQVTPFFGLASEATCFVVPFRASRRTAVGLAGYAPRLVPSRGHSALIPDATVPSGPARSACRSVHGWSGAVLLFPSPYHGVLAVKSCACGHAGVLTAVADP